MAKSFIDIGRFNVCMYGIYLIDLGKNVNMAAMSIRGKIFIDGVSSERTGWYFQSMACQIMPSRTFKSLLDILYERSVLRDKPVLA